jgi:hypothetical protein
MQVREEGDIGVGHGVDRAIVVVVLGGHDPLGSGELLFQVMGDGLLLFPSEAVARSRTRASSGVLHATAMVARRASCSRCTVAAAA